MFFKNNVEQNNNPKKFIINCALDIIHPYIFTVQSIKLYNNQSKSETCPQINYSIINICKKNAIFCYIFYVIPYKSKIFFSETAFILKNVAAKPVYS